MGCSGAKPAIERPTSSRLTVWGDYFNSETRTLLAILNICKVQYTFTKVNTLNEEHRQPSYMS